MCSAGACTPPATSGHSGAVEAREGYEPKAARDGCPQQGHSGKAQHLSGPGTTRRKGLQRRSLRSTSEQARQASGEPPTAGSRSARHHSPAHESILAIYHQFRHLWRRTPAGSAAAQLPEQRGPGAALPPPPPLPLWPLEVVLLGFPVMHVSVGSAAAAA